MLDKIKTKNNKSKYHKKSHRKTNKKTQKNVLKSKAFLKILKGGSNKYAIKELKIPDIIKTFLEDVKTQAELKKQTIKSNTNSPPSYSKSSDLPPSYYNSELIKFLQNIKQKPKSSKKNQSLVLSNFSANYTNTNANISKPLIYNTNESSTNNNNTTDLIYREAQKIGNDTNNKNRYYDALLKHIEGAKLDNIKCLVMILYYLISKNMTLCDSTNKKKNNDNKDCNMKGDGINNISIVIDFNTNIIPILTFIENNMLDIKEKLKIDNFNIGEISLIYYRCVIFLKQNNKYGDAIKLFNFAIRLSESNVRLNEVLIRIKKEMEKAQSEFLKKQKQNQTQKKGWFF